MWSGTANRIVFQSVLLLVIATVAAPERSAWISTARGQVGAKPLATSKSQPAASDARNQDRSAIEAALASFAQAFEAGDAKSLAAHWTAEGEYQNDSGITVRGRDSLESSFAAFFAASPDAKAEVRPEALRFLSRDAAVAEGTVAVRRGPADPAKSAQYSALFVRDEGHWRMAQLRESSRNEPTIEDLGWLIGEWKSANNEGAEIRSTYSWDANKKFIHVRFTVQEKTIGFGGTQIIGVDPATGGIRSWTFEARGGVAEADWQRDGDNWVLDAVGTMPDGRILSETNVLRRVNDDTITWQSVDRTLDDVDVPDLAPVKVTRVKPQR
jgi:uncharacterized protein (TIGR02246 family)